MMIDYSSCVELNQAQDVQVRGFDMETALGYPEPLDGN